MQREERPQTRHLDLPACFNVRDLGGYQTADGRPTRWRAVLRGDNLCWLTPDSAAALVGYGVRTVIDLRHPTEVAAAPHPFAARRAAGDPVYLNLTLSEPGDRDLRRRLDEARTNAEAYRLILDRGLHRIAAILRAMAEAPDGGILFHCNAGKDRAGLIAALLLRLVGVPPQTVAHDYALSESRLRPYYASVIKKVPDDADGLARLAERLASRPETMLAMLAHLESEHGGVEEYVTAAGLSPAELERLRERLLAAA